MRLGLHFPLYTYTDNKLLYDGTRLRASFVSADAKESSLSGIEADPIAVVPIQTAAREVWLKRWVQTTKLDFARQIPGPCQPDRAAWAVVTST